MTDFVSMFSPNDLRSKEALAYALGFINGLRRIPVIGKISEEMIDQISLTLLTLEVENRKEIEEGKNLDPAITLLIHSPGGDVDSTLRLKNVIDGLNSPVDALVIGYAQSMAADIVQMCRKRMMLSYSHLFCHFVRHGFHLIADFDEPTELEFRAFNQRAMDSKRKREELYMARTGKSREEVLELFTLGEKFNIYFTAEEALKRNLIDEIVTDFKFLPRASKENPNDDLEMRPGWSKAGSEE